MLDLWHISRGNIDLADVAALPLRYMFAVELDDADRSVVGTMLEDTLDRRRLCGEGALDVPSFIRAIRAAGFDGPWGSRSYPTNTASGISMTRLRSPTRLR